MSVRRAAVVVPICKQRALILERAAHLRFQPSFFSFPGGALEAADNRPGRPGPGPAAARHAAWRELLEETGLAAPGEYHESTDSLRVKLLAGQDVDLSPYWASVDWSRWRYLGVWTTPEYAHMRFETHFFSCRFDDELEPYPNDELERVFWLDEAQTVADWQAGELPASQPVLAALRAAFHPQEPFEHAGSARDLLCAGGGLRYLPLRTPTLPPATHTNCALIGGEGQIYAVDPAAFDPAERDLLWQHLSDLERQGEQFSGVILTHLHHDHLGAADWLARKAGVDVYATARTRDDLAAGLGSGISAGGNTADHLPRVSQLLAEGDLLAGGWEVLETPGHAHGHLCLWQASSRCLVAGDMIASASTILIEPEQGDLISYLESLERLAELEPNIILASHGMPLAQGGHALRSLIAHRLMREAKVIDALERLGRGSLSQLVALAYDDTPSELWPLAELSLHSHLIKLGYQERAVAHADGQWSVDDKH
jgi:glyoxylase-like metal-dependent hydrolase (beta-lactamase superfamily II)/8-oxo-dGTP pyrophosphatase MutT (NUDIX family)